MRIEEFELIVSARAVNSACRRKRASFSQSVKRERFSRDRKGGSMDNRHSNRCHLSSRGIRYNNLKGLCPSIGWPQTTIDEALCRGCVHCS
jgi:hypothetical protein